MLIDVRGDRSTYEAIQVKARTRAGDETPSVMYCTDLWFAVCSAK